MIILLPTHRRKKNFSLVTCLQLSVLSAAPSQEQCTTCPLLRAVLEPVIMQNNLMVGLELQNPQPMLSPGMSSKSF